MSEAKILTLDIETSPHLADVWGLFKQNVGINQLKDSTRVIAFAAKWYGKKPVEFRSEHHDGHEAMVRRAHEMLSDADIVVHYNGTSFDLPHLRREFLKLNMAPPPPVLEIDLLRVAKGRFRFASNKLDYVAQYLGIGGKVKHEGHDLWIKCMAGDPKAWGRMARYNKQDVVLTEQLYDRLKPWIKTHPPLNLFAEDEIDGCPKCGSDDVIRQGFAYTSVSRYQRYQCKGCGSWLRSGTGGTRGDLRNAA